VKNIAAVFITHAHADHVLGANDLHKYAHHRVLPIFANPRAADELNKSYSYIFSENSALRLHWITTLDAIRINDIEVIPIPMLHGRLPTTGYRVGKFAYLTDTNEIPDESFDLLQGVEAVVIDGLQSEPSSTHFSFGEALAALTRFRPRRAWITHICHAHSPRRSNRSPQS
jgi:phosphoribosyl 1,2-cyclic phosphate phosphodiesterase